MQRVEKIECSNCGAANVFKTGPNEYKCNYCQTDFTINPRNNSDPINTLNSSQVQDISTNTSTKALKYVILLGGVMAILCVVGVFVLMKPNSKFDNQIKIVDSNSSYQKPQFEDGFIYSASNYESIVLVYKQQTKSLDSARNVLVIINPKTKKIIAQKIVIVDTWQMLTFNKPAKFYLGNNLIYCNYQDSGLIAFNLTNLNQEMFSNYFSKNYKDLKDGIAKVTKEHGKPIVKITSNFGGTYYFNLQFKQLLSEVEYSKKEKPNYQIQSKIFFSQNENPFLIVAEKKCNSVDNEFILPIKDTSEIKNLLVKKYNFYTIKSVKAIPSKTYFNAEFYARYQDGIILSYKDNLSEKANINLEFINKEGVSQWSIHNETVQKLLKSESGIISSEGFINNSKLYLTINSYPKKFICINCLNGIIDWNFNIEEIKNEI